MMKRSIGGKIFDVFNTVMLLLLVAVCLYPFYYVVVVSISDPVELYKHKGLMFAPAGLDFGSYVKVFNHKSIVSGYLNTIFYLVTGTALNLFATSWAAYILSRKQLMLRRFFTLFMVFTMYVSGGMIPFYLLMKDLHLINNRLVIILPGCISVYNMLILITSFGDIPDSLEESAKIDGASEWTVLFKIILPLAKPVMMVIMLYVMVYFWNFWLEALLYLRDHDKQPLQLILRNILNGAELSTTGDMDVEDAGTTIKYAAIVVATVPILCVYPFIQKYFVKGVMIGAVKG